MNKIMSFFGMYMYSFSVCRVLLLSRRSWNVLCWEIICPQASQTCCDSFTYYGHVI